jgi:putative transposase
MPTSSTGTPSSPTSRAITNAVLQHVAERDATRSSESKKKKEKKKNAENPPPQKKQKTEDAPKKQGATKCVKYRIFPDANQRATLRLWTDATRWVYNRAVEKLNAREPGSKESLELLREWGGTAEEAWTKQKADGGETPERFRGIPYEIRDSPIRDIAAACAALRSKEKAVKRKLKFRRRKDDVASITLRMRLLNCKTGRGSVWPSLFGTVKDRSAMRTERGKTLPLVFSHDCRLVYERRTRFFYLCVPMSAAPAVAVRMIASGDCEQGTLPDTQGESTLDAGGRGADIERGEQKRGKLVAIDPGVRTFGTCYDPDGVITEWAEGSAPSGRWKGKGEVRDKPVTHLVVLFRLNRKAGRIEARASRVGGRKKRRLTAAAARLRKRSIDLVNELHRKFARWLCANYEVVLLPKFDTRSITQKRSETTGEWKRKIGRKTAGSTVRLAHYKFRNFLLHKATEFPGTKIELCDEQYTSKTCGSCGRLNETLGASKTFQCAHWMCERVVDRDHNAARNILLRYLAVNDITVGDCV